MVHQAAMQGEKLRKGPWNEEKEELLVTFVTLLVERRWDYIAKASGMFFYRIEIGKETLLSHLIDLISLNYLLAGLQRSGKSCRLRWLDYLHPNIKHGYISTEEEQFIIQLHEKWGNRKDSISSFVKICLHRHTV